MAATAPTNPVSRPVLLIAGATAGMLLALTAGLWAHYGTSVFYEIILAGLAACF
jgi:hypothetical protein